MVYDDIDIGALVRVSVEFTDNNGNDIDPSAVFFRTMDPTGTIATYTFGTDIGLKRDSLGRYHFDVSASIAGDWLCRWYSTGTGQTAEDAAFTVEGSPLA